MAVPEIVRRYFDAWNARDAGGIVAAFAPDGVYEDPATGGPLRRDAIGAYAAGLWQAFPDLAVEVVSAAATADGAAAEWVMRGTNRGGFMGLPPTSRPIELPGVDVIKVRDGRLASVRGYFDAAALPRQLGLQVTVQPERAGPFVFGSSTFVPGTRRSVPGAFSITVLHYEGQEELDRVRGWSRRIAAELPQAEGFLGWAGAAVGGRAITITAWEHPDQPRQLLRSGTHREAMPAFFQGDVGRGGWTSVWIPARVNPMWIRCRSCGAMRDYHACGGRCDCGVALPEPPPYFG
jgi:steroid delta-isomerase-like uncharacterized protein